MRRYRVISFICALALLIPLLIIPAYFGISISEGKIEMEDYQRPDDPAEFLTFRILDSYYLLFVLLNVFPFMLLVFWSFGARASERRRRKQAEKGRLVIEDKDRKGADLFTGTRYRNCNSKITFDALMLTNKYIEDNSIDRIVFSIVCDDSNFLAILTKAVNAPFSLFMASWIPG